MKLCTPDASALAALDETAGQVVVSVVIPCFNRRDMVIKSARSALSQSGVAVEVIVVDDCSSEDIASALGEIGDERLRVIRLSQNGGGANARNVGIADARGRYIALLDSDDWWTPEKLARQLALISDEMKVSDNWLIYNRIRHQGATSTEFRPSRAFDGSKDDLAYYVLVEKNFIQTSGLFAPKSLLQRHAFDVACRRHQDVDLLIRMDRAGVELKHCDADSVIYFDHDGADRVGQLRSVQPSLDWINYRRSYLSRKVRAYLYVYYIGIIMCRQKQMTGLLFLSKGILMDPSLIPKLIAKFWNEIILRKRSNAG